MRPICCNATVDAEIVFIDDCSQWQAVKGIHNVKINILIILLPRLRVEVHDLSHLSGFMITSQHKNFAGKFYL